MILSSKGQNFVQQKSGAGRRGRQHGTTVDRVAAVLVPCPWNQTISRSYQPAELGSRQMPFRSNQSLRFGGSEETMLVPRAHHCGQIDRVGLILTKKTTDLFHILFNRSLVKF
jgi:hypothetical protein